MSLSPFPFSVACELFVQVTSISPAEIAVNATLDGAANGVETDDFTALGHAIRSD
jgi:hypothetical protein